MAVGRMFQGEKSRWSLFCVQHFSGGQGCLTGSAGCGPVAENTSKPTDPNENPINRTADFLIGIGRKFLAKRK